MFAVIVNTVAIILGCSVGLMLRKGLPKRLTDSVMEALGVCTVAIGVEGIIHEEHVLVMIIAMVLGVLFGAAFRLDDRVYAGSEQLLSRFAGEGEGAKIAKAFVTSCLIMNVGAMVIVGSLQAGLAEDYTMLYTKSLLDFCSGIMMTAAMGVGVFGSAAFTLIFQGAIVLMAVWLAPFLSDAVIAEMSTTGCLLILMIGFNMLNLTKFKLIDYLPALLFAPILMMIVERLGF